MHKICIWMNIPSHYQSAFFQALDERPEVDLRVAYFNGASEARAKEGWKSDHEFKPYEVQVRDGSSPQSMLAEVPDWRERVHVICGYFSAELVDWFCAQGSLWCHWSEMPGIRLAELLGYRTSLFRLLDPLMLWGKRAEGRLIRRHALGAFGQGYRARRAFRLMGVPDSMIRDLFYVPVPPSGAEPSAQVADFARGRKVFLSVGALCRRKGIDVLLRAFAKLSSADWCLVLCGLDRADGAYQKLAEELKIGDRVLFLGAYPSDRITEVYAASDVFVLASRFDGWGAVENEAAALGLPIIGTDLCGASWHVVQPNRTGFRVRAGSVHSLSRAMARYVADPALAEKHGAAAREHFIEFTPASNAQRVVDALEDWSRI